MSDDESKLDLIEGLPVKRLFESFSGLAQQPAGDDTARWRGRILGGYQLEEEVNRGGMGVVFRASQHTLDRPVAVKVLRSGGFAGEDELARFQGEAQLLGQLEHPNIVPIYEVGEEDGQPFIAMKWIESTLLDHIGELRDHPRRSVEIMVKVGSAIHEAHRRGILHRDLKPANVLVDESGEPHVTDFGLARRLDDDSEMTRTRAIMGSPNYMSPEQAKGGSEALTTGVDVFGLGAVLYHLLSGHPPFEGATAIEVIKKVELAAPRRPSSTNPKIDRDLETICLKCLRKNPQERYSSALEFVQDLEHWLAGEPIQARPLGLIERQLKWARRHPWRAASIAGIFLVALGGIALDASYRQKLRTSRDSALESQLEERESNRRLESAITHLQLERAEQEFASGKQRSGLRYLLEILDKDPLNRVASERLVHEWERRRFPIDAVPPVDLADPGRLVRYSADGERLAVAGDSTLRVFEASGGTPLMGAIELGRQPKALDLSNDGSILLIASDAKVSLFTVPGGELLLEWADPDKAISDAELLPDGSGFVVASGSRFSLHGADGGTELAAVQLKHAMLGGGICISPDGAFVVIARRSRLGKYRLPDLSLEIETEPYAASHLSISGDGTRLVSLSADQEEHQIWHTGSLEPIGPVREHRTVALGAKLDRDGRRCIVNFVAGRVEFSDAETGSLLSQPISVDGNIRDLAFAPSGETFAGVSSRGLLRRWTAESEKFPAISPAPTYVSTLNTFDTSQTIRAQRGRDRDGFINSKATGIQRPFASGESIWMASISPGGEDLALVSHRGDSARVTVLDAESLELKHEVIEGPMPFYAKYTPDGKKLVVVSGSIGMKVWDRSLGEFTAEAADFPLIGRLSFSPSGNEILASDRRGGISSWSLATGQPSAVLAEHGIFAGGVAISPDGEMLLTGGFDNCVRWWRIGDRGGELAGESKFHGAVKWVSFSPDGAQLFVAGARTGRFRVWDSATFEELCDVQAHDLALTTVRFTADGKRILTISMDGTARIWDARSGFPVTSPMPHDVWWEVPEVTLPLSAELVAEISRHVRG